MLRRQGARVLSRNEQRRASRPIEHGGVLIIAVTLVFARLVRKGQRVAEVNFRRHNVLLLITAQSVQQLRAAHCGDGLLDQRLPFLQRRRRSRARGRFAFRFKEVLRRGLEKLFALVRTEEVDAPLIDREQIGNATGRRAHARAMAAQLDFVARRVLLERRFVRGVGEHVAEQPARHSDVQFALRLFALREHDRVKPSERVKRRLPLRISLTGQCAA
ncbi:MAG: hypothetical protein JMDDDDMK_02853 [Acidobacteria bacterium]|nr:hypothetical protein [Acidobacteriota bacterium]